jgi:hypothetical protein
MYCQLISTAGCGLLVEGRKTTLAMGRQETLIAEPAGRSDAFEQACPAMVCSLSIENHQSLTKSVSLCL